ncbi:MAG: energy transducer TonB [Acidobacteriota bacterium]
MSSTPMRYAAIVLAALIASTPPCVGDAGNDQTSALIAEAHELSAAGEIEEAIAKLEQVDASTGGASLDAALLLAILSNNAGETKDAIRYAKKALDLDPPSDQAADAHFQLGIAHLNRAAPDSGGSWSSRGLRRAEEALREAVRLEGPRVLEAKAHLGYVLVLRENQKSTPTEAGYDDAFALARERYEDGSPGSGLAVARHVLCGSPTCEPYVPSRERTVPMASLLGEGKGAVQPPKRLTPDSIPGITYARSHGVRGKVVAIGVVTAEGRLADIRIVEGLPLGINEMVVDDLRRRRYEPATQDGEPVPVTINMTFTYR